MLQSFSKLFIVANYQINKEYITKVFCENKAKPTMHCNGKCHLKKQLAKEDKKENSTTNNIKEKIEIQLFTETKTPLELPNEFKIINHHFFYSMSKSNSHLLSVFHPPSC
jgi:hypothetical protein